jgi:hypothetical protein
MAYSLEQQYSRDIDWYFNDKNKNLIHVASAGGRLPKKIEENDVLIDLLHSQILELPSQFEVTINSILGEFVSFESNEARELYLTDFKEMAQRGLISIDKTKLGNFEDLTYHIVAFPKNATSVDAFYNLTDKVFNSKETIDTGNNKPFNLFNYFE